MGKPRPIECEFETSDDEEAYQRWFRAKVEARLAATCPAVPNAAAMSQLDRIIEQADRELP